MTEVFVSWSGERSKAVAYALRDWLPKVMNALKPWLSASDIEKGTRWTNEIAEKLSSSSVGIICLTPENLHEDWILFEAGALSKLQNAYVCTFLVGLGSTEVEFPLAQFQSTRATKDEVFELLRTLNGRLGVDALSDAHLTDAFEMWWPRLEDKLESLPRVVSPTAKRSDRALIEEILKLVRMQALYAPRQDLLDEVLRVGSEATPRERSFVQVALDAFNSIDPNAIVMSREVSPTGVTVSGVNSKGQNFVVRVPPKTSIERVSEMIKGQVFPKAIARKASKRAKPAH